MVDYNKNLISKYRITNYELIKIILSNYSPVVQRIILVSSNNEGTKTYNTEILIFTQLQKISSVDENKILIRPPGTTILSKIERQFKKEHRLKSYE